MVTWLIPANGCPQHGADACHRAPPPRWSQPGLAADPWAFAAAMAGAARGVGRLRPTHFWLFDLVM